MAKISVQYLGDLHTECTHPSGAKIQTDAPKDNQGKGEAFSPTDLFAASLPSCMLTIMGIAAKRLGVELKGAHAEVVKEMALAPQRRVGKLHVRIQIPGVYSPEIRVKLEKAALECPVHHSLHPDIEVKTDFSWGP